MFYWLIACEFDVWIRIPIIYVINKFFLIYSYGRVQNVKLLGRTESGSTVANASGGTNSGVCATVAFMDIKSASKAHNAEHVLDERTLTTEYYEPAAIPSAAGAPSAGSSPAGSGYSGSSSSVNSTPAPSSVSRYHLSWVLIFVAVLLYMICV